MEEDAGAGDKTLLKADKLPGKRIRRPASPQLFPARSLAILTLFSIVFLFLVGYSFRARQQDVKACNMSYMYPSYRHLHGFDLEHTRFAPKYSLYLYREQTIDLSDEPQGVPVLFVPGNAGSYKQIRPIAAEAAAQFQRLAKDEVDISRRGRRSLDFFTVDFNEDFSAFHGQTMLDQAEYLNSAITYILSLYTDARKSPSDKSLPDPTSVIIIGHSMGGIVARLMQVMPNYLPKSINTIITMSTPHAIPPAPFDPRIQGIYEDINTFWHKSFSLPTKENPLADVTIVSIAGGGLDTIVSSDYTSVRTIVPPSNGFTVYTSTIPYVWVSADHQAILWCDQFRKVVARALLDVVDVRRGTQTKSVPQRMAVFRNNFLSRLDRGISSPTLANQQRISVRIDTTDVELEHNIILDAGLLRTSTGKTSGAIDLIPIPATSNTSFQILSNVPSVPSSVKGASLSIYICRRDSDYAKSDYEEKMQLTCTDVSQDLVTIPSQQDLRRSGGSERLSYLQYDRLALIGYEFFAVKSSDFGHGHFVAGEILPTAVAAEVHLPVSLFSLFFGGLRVVLGPSQTLSSIIKFDGSFSSMIAYRLHVSKGCQTNRMESVTRQYSAAPYETKYHIGDRAIDISIHGKAPFFPALYDEHEGLVIQHWADPTCTGTVDVTLSVDYFGSLGKLVMRYRVVLVVFPMAIALVIFGIQIRTFDKTGHFVSFQQGQRQFVRSVLPIMLVVVSATSILLAHHQDRSKMSLATYFETDQQVASFSDKYVMFENDKLLGLQELFLWWLAPLFLLTSIGALNVVSTMLAVLINAAAMGISFITRTSSSTLEQSIIRSFRRRFLTTIALLLFVSFVVPYQFAYIVACIVQLATCVRLARCTDSPRATKAYNFNFAILVLMFCVLPINIPILVVWIRNLSVQWFTPFSSHHNVLSIAPTILLVESLTTGQMLPAISSPLEKVLGLVLMAMSCTICLYGVMYTYLLHHALNILMAVIFLYQHLALFHHHHHHHQHTASKKDGKK